MAVNLKNYYDQYSEGNLAGLYNQPGGPTIPNPNDNNNNNAARYQSPGSTLNNNPAPLITVPVTKEAMGNSGEGLLSAIAGGGLESIPGVGGLGGDVLGVLNDALGGVFEDLAAGAKDAVRISKFFYTTPEGIAFNLQQVGLQAMNTRIPHGGVNGGSGFIGSTANDPRIYNLGVNLLAQVPLEAIDIHIERHGAYPTFREYPDNKGVYSEYYKSHQSDYDSSLISLGEKFMGVNTGTGGPSQLMLSIQNFAANASSFFSGLSSIPLIGGTLSGLGNIFGSAGGSTGGSVSNIGGELFSYGGGPKSILGIGNTSHTRWVQTNDDPNREKGVKPFSAVPDLDIQGTPPTDINIPIISTTALRGLPSTLKGLEQENKTLFRNASIGRVSKRNNAERQNLRIPSGDAIDKVNNLGLLKGPRSDKLGKINDALIDKFGFKNQPEDLPKDLVKFRFEAIDNDSPTESIFVIFRAFLSNISDRFGANWSDNQYVGRGEKFFIYNGFDRDISFNFSIAPQTRHEVKPLIQKLNFLASNLAPDYNDAGRMRGSFMKLTIGDYFVSLPGFISSLTYTIRDDSPWDIALYKDLDGNDFERNERELPHMIDVSVSYKPIHDFLPKKGTNDVFYMLGVGDKWITQIPSANEEWTKTVDGVDIINTIDEEEEYEFDFDEAELETNNLTNQILNEGLGDFESSDINNLA